MIRTCPFCQQQHDDAISPCPGNHSRVAAGAQDDPLIGQVLRDRYQITSLLGKGAMGVVYKGTQLNDGKDVALKVLHTHLSSDPESIKRFQYEAKAASSLMHPNIVRLYDFGMTPNGQPYIAMEYLEGKTLGEVIRDRRYFDTRDALPIIRQACEALAEAHSHGVLHRDIKPANIMLMNRFGQENFVVVLDFSISKVIHRVSDVETTTPGLVFGSPAYMSPERFKGRSGDFRADIYSMGVIIFQMLAGRAPFKSTDLYALMNDVVSAEPPSVKDVRPDADIPDSLQETISRALAKEPDERHSNMKQLLSEINNVYLETSSLVTPVNGLNESAPPVPDPAARQAALSSMRATQDLSTKKNEAPVFDINPGYTPPLAVPTLQQPPPATNGGRKQSVNTTLEEQLRNSDLSTSGKWDKSLIVKNTSDRQRPLIRPPDRGGRLPLELVALIVVMVIGCAAIFMRLLPSEQTVSTHRTKINEFLSKENLQGAENVLRSWSPAEPETDAYAESCINIGKIYVRKKDTQSAMQLFELVPKQSNKWNEAQKLLKQCASTRNGS